MATLRPGFGPGLPDLLAPRVRSTPQRVRRVLAVGLALVVLLGLVRMVVGGGSTLDEDVLITEPIAFTLGYKDGLQRVEAAPGELLRLQTPSGEERFERYTVKPLQLSPYRGDQAGVLPVLAAREVVTLRKEFPDGFRFRGDGRARINELPGHQVLFQARIDGRTHYGKRFFLLPEVAPPLLAREGVVITLLAARSPAIPKVEDVGVFGLLKGPLRSFRFGTERP